MQILPGVFLINGSPYGRHQNGYLVQREGATVLVDSGDLEDGECLAEVERNAARWEIPLEEASHLFVTHPHFDHASHAAALQRKGIRIVASSPTTAAMAAGDDRCVGYAVHREFEPCRADVTMGDGQEILVMPDRTEVPTGSGIALDAAPAGEAGRSLSAGGLTVRCIAAPGHAAGLVVYEMVINGERCWFVGDLLLTAHAHRSVELPWTGGPDFDRATYVRTMARLVRMPCDHLFPGHGPAAIGCGKRVIEMAYTQALQKWR